MNLELYHMESTQHALSYFCHNISSTVSTVSTKHNSSMTTPEAKIDITCAQFNLGYQDQMVHVWIGLCWIQPLTIRFDITLDQTWPNHWPSPSNSSMRTLYQFNHPKKLQHWFIQSNPSGEHQSTFWLAPLPPPLLSTTKCDFSATLPSWSWCDLSTAVIVFVNKIKSNLRY